MNELSSDARALVEAARGHDGPDARDRERVKERLARQLGVSAFAGAAAVTMVRGTASSTSAPTLMRGSKVAPKSANVAAREVARRGGAPWIKSLGKIAAAATAAGAIYSGVTQLGPTRRAASTRGVEQLEPAPPPALEPIIEPLADTQSQLAPADVPAVTHSGAPREGRHARRERGATAPAAKASGNSLAEELSLLARAQRALREDDPQRALAIVQEHTARFPEGSLQEERSGIEALARCLLGESQADSVQAFLKRSPSSPLAARVRKECGSR